MPPAHPFGVEPVAQAVAHGERVVADAAIQGEVDAARNPLPERNVAREVVVAETPGDVTETRRPLARLLDGQREHRVQRAEKALGESVDDPAVDEDPRWKRVGEDEPGRARHR